MNRKEIYDALDLPNEDTTQISCRGSSCGIYR